MKIIIQTIKHENQRYPTVGDWEVDDRGNLKISISEFGDSFGEMCVAVHEFVEVLLCLKRNISQLQVDEFDKRYEENRSAGDTSEPGDSPLAPYHKEHFFATTIERLLAAELGIDWKAYEDKINSL